MTSNGTANPVPFGLMRSRFKAAVNVLRGRPTIYRARIEHDGKVYLGCGADQHGLQVWDSAFPARQHIAIGRHTT